MQRSRGLVGFLVVFLLVAAGGSNAKRVDFDAPPAGPMVVASPSVLPTSLTNITISWSGIEFPSDLDFLAIYSPANATNFIGYQ